MRKPFVALCAAALLGACGTTVPRTTQLASPNSSATTATTTSDGVTSDGSPDNPALAGASGVTGTAPARSIGAGQSASPESSEVVAAPGSSGTGNPAGAGPGTGRPVAAATAGTAAKKAGATKSAGQGVGGKPTGAPGSKAGSGSPTGKAPAVTSPIMVGVTYIDNGTSSAALGGMVATTVTQKQAAEGMIAGLNASGGIDGRRIVADEISFNTDDANYSTDVSAACQKFTQDDKVSVVVDTAFGTTDGFDSCLAKAGVLDIDSSDEEAAATSAVAPLHENTSFMSPDRQYSSVVSGLTASGYLSRSSQLGIIVEGCPNNLAAYHDTVVPLISKLGLKKPVTAQLDCTTGFSSAGPAASAIAGDVLTFRQDGVDRVMIISEAEEATALLLFSEAASSQKYDPGYALSTSADTGAVRTSLPRDQWPQLTGIGYFPSVDSEETPTPLPAATRCLNLERAGQVSPASNADFFYVYLECAPFLMLESALKVTNGSNDPQALTNAINGLGTSFADPGPGGELSSFADNRHDGPDQVRQFGYVTGCGCIHYSGSPFPAAH